MSATRANDVVMVAVRKRVSGLAFYIDAFDEFFGKQEFERTVHGGFVNLYMCYVLRNGMRSGLRCERFNHGSTSVRNTVAAFLECRDSVLDCLLHRMVYGTLLQVICNKCFWHKDA